MTATRAWVQPTPVGPIAVVASSQPEGWAVRRIGFGDEAATTGGADEPVAEIAVALDAWFSGRNHDLPLPVALDLAPGFLRDVLTVLRHEVGWGETVTYGELAAMAGRPGAARAVGSAMAANPVPFVIPCHRVIAAGGRIGGYGGTAATASAHVAIKRWLLEREGVHPRP